MIKINHEYECFRFPDEEGFYPFEILALRTLKLHLFRVVVFAFTTDARQRWTDYRDCSFEYLVIHLIVFDYYFQLLDYRAKYRKSLFAVET